MTTSSHAGSRLDMEARGLTGRVRVSAPYCNTEDEIARFVGALTRISSD